MLLFRIFFVLLRQQFLKRFHSFEAKSLNVTHIQFFQVLLSIIQLISEFHLTFEAVKFFYI